MSQLDFVIAGFAKCGTTSLYRYLLQHPELFLTTPKETNHFVEPYFNEFAEEYWSMFDQANFDQSKGEASVSYSESEFIELASRRLYQHNPELKIIFLVRDPIKRVESQFRELHDSGFKIKLSCPFDLGEAMLKIPGIITDTHYYRLTCRYISLFGEDRVKIVFLEELIAQPQFVLSDLLSFLGVKETDYRFNLNEQHNASQYKYRDTLFFRKLKSVRGAGILNTKVIDLPFAERERLYRRQGWRQPFANEAVVWSELAKRLCLSGLRTDILNFLACHTKKISLWPHFQRMCEQAK